MHIVITGGAISLGVGLARSLLALWLRDLVHAK